MPQKVALRPDQFCGSGPPAWSVLEIEPTNDECWFHARTLDSAAARSNSYVRHQQIPEPNALYRFWIRVRNRQFVNGASAAANNGAALVRVMRAAHGLATGDSVTVADVPGANGTFAVARHGGLLLSSARLSCSIIASPQRASASVSKAWSGMWQASSGPKWVAMPSVGTPSGVLPAT